MQVKSFLFVFQVYYLIWTRSMRYWYNTMHAKTLPQFKFKDLKKYFLYLQPHLGD